MREGVATIKYAQCWEDADILTEALQVQPGQTCLSIASGGDNTLALVAQAPGRVIAVDQNPLQLYCLELRVAAYKTLCHAELLELVGSRLSMRRTELYRKCRPELAQEARQFWDAHAGGIEAGIGSTGKFERYFRTFRRSILPWALGKNTVSLLLQGGTEAHRREVYRQRVDTWRFRSAFRFFFSTFVMAKLGRDSSAFRFVEGAVADPLLARTRHALTVLDPAENPYMQWILTGRHGSALPYALRPDHFESIRDNLGCLELRCQPLAEALEQMDSAEIDHFNLSDVFEYVPKFQCDALFEDILRAGRAGGRVAYWNMLVPRKRPEQLVDRLHSLSETAADLHARDKAFFYSAFQLESIQ